MVIRTSHLFIIHPLNYVVLVVMFARVDHFALARLLMSTHLFALHSIRHFIRPPQWQPTRPRSSPDFLAVPQLTLLAALLRQIPKLPLAQ